MLRTVDTRVRDLDTLLRASQTPFLFSGAWCVGSDVERRPNVMQMQLPAPSWPRLIGVMLIAC